MQKKLSILKRIKFYIVKTPFPFGPQGGMTDLYGTLTPLPFDSFYLHPAMLSHARYYFYGQANFLLNTDIDEIVVEKTGSSVQRFMIEKSLNYVYFSQVYVYSALVDEKLKLEDVYLKKEESSYACQKWACFPKQIGAISNLISMLFMDKDKFREQHHKISSISNIK